MWFDGEKKNKRFMNISDDAEVEDLRLKLLTIRFRDVLMKIFSSFRILS